MAIVSRRSPCAQCGYFGCDRGLQPSPCFSCIQPQLWHDSGEFEYIPFPMENEPEQAEPQIDYFGEEDIPQEPERVFLMFPGLREWAKRMEHKYLW